MFAEPPPAPAAPCSIAAPERALTDRDIEPEPFVSSDDGAVYVLVPALGEPVTIADAHALRDSLSRYLGRLVAPLVLVVGFATMLGGCWTTG